MTNIYIVMAFFNDFGDVLAAILDVKKANG